MNGARLTKWSLVGLWVIGIVFWPDATDNDSALEVTANLSPGESLYKADLTATNFGLLGVHFFESADNRRNWDIRSKFAELNRKDDYFYLQQVNSDFYGRDTGNIIHTTSDFGRSYLGRNFVELEGNVQVVSAQGYEFRMQKLDYNGANRTFFTDTPVAMKGPDTKNPAMILDGVGMKGSADKEHFVIQKNVQARRRMSTSEWLNIRSQSGEFFTQNQKAIFHRKVRAQMPRITILSDRFELETNQGSETIVALGHVVLYNRDRTGRAQKATVKMGEDEILLEGKAEIETGDDRMKGDQIRIYSEDDRVEVRAAEGIMRR
jgi:LPS export ABC transporter protein LptC/lipopolysaccharide transport protein LptA